MPPDHLHLWDRQPGEPPRAYHSFAHYRDLGATRSLAAAYRAHAVACKGVPVGNHSGPSRHWKRLSTRWGWVARVERWDAYVDQEVRQRTAQEQAEVRARHARLAQGALTSLTIPVRATIEILKDGAVLQQLIARARKDPDAFLELIGVVIRVAQTLPGLINAERLALGLTATPSVDERRDVTIASRIPTDPVATDLAIQLLELMSGPGPVQ